MQLLLATRNTNKLREIRAILDGTGLEVVGLDDVEGLPDEIPEEGATFEDNALHKARVVHAHTGLPTIADDSGLEVYALGMAPGIHSKRWTPNADDEDNNDHLVASLDGADDRRARYRCAVAVVCDAGDAVADGVCEGTIGFERRGSGGFGYDPLFWPTDEPGRTMAELSMAEKNAISHRGRATRELPRLLRDLGLLPPA